MHNSQYKHNREILNADIFKPESTTFGDWYITIMFYGAMHLVEEHLAKTNFHSESHEIRNNAVLRVVPLKNVAGAYFTLYNQSRRARYKCVSFSQNDLKRLENCLHEIEDELIRN
jgi:hypothetical protein